jgi:glycerol-3-phosphate O-acyltransferase
VVLLARTSTAVEHELVSAAADQLRGGAHPTRVASDAASAIELAGDGELVAPVRVVWGSDPAHSSQRPQIRDLAASSAPSVVQGRLQRARLARDPDCCRVLVGEPAALSELEARWAERSGDHAVGASREHLAAFVERQADIVLERAQRRLAGERYRAPQHVVEELASSLAWMDGIAALSARLQREQEGVQADAREYLEEMATEQQRVARDIWARWAHFLYSRGYRLSFDRESLERVRELGARYPLVFLPSHRSNLDGYVMASLLYEQGMPPNHTLGGINMAFWPIGPLGRRVGVIWIRRSFRDNEVYKFVLRSYLGYLVGKRFNLEWYIEGGRSRTGKMLPPRLGLFNYLADAVEELGTEIQVIPVSIVYEELQEVHEMTTESRGAVKPAEGLRWLIRFAREQRGSFGAVQVNFGQPLNLAEALRVDGPDQERSRARLARSKAAFEVCTRINRATPVTATSLVTLALLGDDRALTLGEVRRVLDPLLAYVHIRGIPEVNGSERLDSTAGLTRTLTQLERHGVVERFAAGAEPVYRIGPDHELVAAFYRNAAIHWFVNRSIVELALLHQPADQADDPAQVALDDAFRLRDLLKMEFFFPEKEEFRLELRGELELIDPDWAHGGPRRLAVLGETIAEGGVLMAHRVLRSFIEAYAIAADALGRLGDEEADAEKTVAAALDLGRQYRLQRRVRSGEALSTHLFRSAFKLAGNRGLLAGGEGQAARRALFAGELGDVLARLRRIDELDRARADGPREVTV